MARILLLIMMQMLVETLLQKLHLDHWFTINSLLFTIKKEHVVTLARCCQSCSRQDVLAERISSFPCVCVGATLSHSALCPVVTRVLYHNTVWPGVRGRVSRDHCSVTSGSDLGSHICTLTLYSPLPPLLISSQHLQISPSIQTRRWLYVRTTTSNILTS